MLDSFLGFIMSVKMNDKLTLIKPCPRCGKRVNLKEDPFRPFCSKKCKEIDLGKWALETYRIPGERVHQDEESFFQEEEEL